MVYIGTSGWQYKDWRRSVYPEDVPQKEWLEWYCRHFRTVELNNSFYNLPAAGCSHAGENAPRQALSWRSR
jgi:uncharacterized protein YecE (DUF72 family)